MSFTDCRHSNDRFTLKAAEEVIPTPRPQEPFEVVPSDPVKVGFGGRELRTGPAHNQTVRASQSQRVQWQLADLEAVDQHVT